ncbi:MAG: AAA family ATPase [Bacteroidales bacterium]|nr:AAA family ATPase [Bacteroidales bacterium]
MAIEKIHIQNYKSLVDVTIDKPNPFTVFVGPNASGKSNVFEALDFYHYLRKVDIFQVVSLFYGESNIINFNSKKTDKLFLSIAFPGEPTSLNAEKGFLKFLDGGIGVIMPFKEHNKNNQNLDFGIHGIEFKHFFDGFLRLFIGKSELVLIPQKDDKILSLDAKNLSKVLKRILLENEVKEEFIDWLSFLVPEFNNIKVISDELSGSDNLLIYEKHTNKPFPRHLISDGTFNIIALLTAVFQSGKPQFLCIEEPENGIHPEAIKELVSFFREQCEEKGHYIWLTTHSQSLVSELKPEEIIVVDKIKGETKIKQFQGEEFYSLKMDDAWLSNVLGGGLI